MSQSTARPLWDNPQRGPESLEARSGARLAVAARWTLFHPRTRRASTVKGLGALFALALAAEGCLVPQSVDSIVNNPHIPPRFDLAAMPSYLLAPELTLYKQGATDQSLGCHCAILFDLPEGVVLEDDVTVDLEARWFVDYDPAVPRSTGVVSTFRLAGGSTGSNIQREGVPYTFRADDLGIVTSGQHVIELVVAERDAYDESNTVLPHRAMSPGYASIVYRFFVDVQVQPDANRPKCPAQLPSMREPSSCR